MPIWLINPDHRRNPQGANRRQGRKCRTPRGNPAHPASYGAKYPLRYSEGIGSHAYETLPGTFRITKAEQARLEHVKAAGEYVPIAERGGGAVHVAASRAPRRRRIAPAARIMSPSPRPAARKMKRHTHWHRVAAHKRRTNPSPAQRAARARFAAAARAGTLKKGRKLGPSKARTATRKRNPTRRMEAEPMARRKRRRRTTAAGHRRRHVRINPRRRRRNPARRLRSHRRRRNPARRRHRSYRRNPGLRGIGGQVMEAAKTAGVILVASAATKKIAGMLPIGQGTAATGTTPAVAPSVPITIAVQIAVGVGLSIAAKKFAPRFAGDVLVGALLAPITTLLTSVPVIGPALSGAPPGLGLFSGRPIKPVGVRGAPPGLGKWSNNNGRGAGALPRAQYY